MKKENTSFFGNFFGAKGRSFAPQDTPVILTNSSQSHVLKQRMQEEKMTHGQTVTANISPVRLERATRGEAVLYFCPMKELEILKIMAAGDGGSLPSEATMEGFTIPQDLKSGLYKLCHVAISSNGTMQVKATSKTTWEKIQD